MVDMGNFDASKVEPSSGDFSPIPNGWHEAQITESEKLDNSNGSGKHLKLTFVITRGEFEGRNLWHRLNLWHESSDKAVQIAYGQMSAICRAVGVLTPRDTTQLHNLPMMVKTKQEPYDNGTAEGGISTRCVDFKAREVGTIQSTKVIATPGAPSVAPWKK